MAAATTTGRRKHGPICTVAGCGGAHKQQGYCPRHYNRFRKYGDPSVLLRRPNGSGTVRANGYVQVYMPAHPLAGSSGFVMEHRVAYFDAVAGADQACRWCGLSVTWSLSWPEHAEALTVDHLDYDRANNHPANLVASCGACNSTRHEGVN
jgi:hypothetical protein